MRRVVTLKQQYGSVGANEIANYPIAEADRMIQLGIARATTREELAASRMPRRRFSANRPVPVVYADDDVAKVAAIEKEAAEMEAAAQIEEEKAKLDAGTKDGKPAGKNSK